MFTQKPPTFYNYENVELQIITYLGSLKVYADRI